MMDSAGGLCVLPYTLSWGNALGLFSLSGAASVTLIHLLFDLSSFSFWILHLSAFNILTQWNTLGLVFFLEEAAQSTGDKPWVLTAPGAERSSISVHQLGNCLI